MNKRIDLLNRDKFVENVVRIVCQLSENRQGCCFAIEGSWGVGKTFVVEAIEEQLSVLQSEETSDDRFFVFHYNCWQHDYYEEPAIAIVYAMQDSIYVDKKIVSEKVEAVLKAGYKIAADKLKEIAGLYLKNSIGVNLIELIQEIDKNKKEIESSQNDGFAEWLNFSQTIESVRESLAEIAKERTVVLVVDELDRCVPQYAIKVMERLHHIFYGLENVVVIMAIDRNQLEHSVEKMFGSGDKSFKIDVEKYLKKFIDFSMLLDNGTLNKSLADKYGFYFARFTSSLKGDMEKVNDILSVLFEGIDIRRQEKIVEKANIIHSIVCNEEEADLSVLAFEIMYEVLKLEKFEDMEDIVEVNEAMNRIMEHALGSKRINLLQEIEKEAWSGGTSYVGSERKRKKNIVFNLSGKVMWYFANIFNKENPYVSQKPIDENVSKGLEIVRKYCQFCEMIQ